ncbi:MAG: hypothetical protein EHM23_08165 [Acidobacteria bacterium]|nr:MAG: hypothetical protein EHM23_08165 [Acidobacteriota bacterium]
MPEYLSPGIYVEEVSGGIKPIEGVGTSTGAFLGIGRKGPIVGAEYEEDVVGKPVLITNFSEFERNFGGFVQGEYLAYAVRQFFVEGGTRCYVARTAHFDNPSDPSSLTATRASLPLGGISTTTTVVLGAGATQATLASNSGMQSGMHLFIEDGQNAARVVITAVSAGNVVQFQNTVIDSIGNPLPIPAIGLGARVTQVVLDVRALNEGSWGNRLRVSVRPTGRLRTTLNMPGSASPFVAPGLAPSSTEAVLASLAGIEEGMPLFISDGVGAVRIRVTQLNEAQSAISFVYLQRNISATTSGLGNGASVTGTIQGKAASVTGDPASAGDTDILLQGTENIERGSVLLLVSENMEALPLSPVIPPGVREARVIVTQVVGNQVFFSTPLAIDFPSGTTVTTEDFSLTVYDGNDSVETFEFLSIEDTNNTDYAPGRVNRGAAASKYVRVREAPLTSGNTPPVRTAQPRRLGSLPTTEGRDGQPDAEGDYIGSESAGTGFFAFDSIDDINILAAPGITFRPVIQAGMTYCENRKDCFFVGELPRETLTVAEVLDFKKGTGSYAGQQALNSKYGALYWPWLEILDPLTNRPMPMPPAGAIAGSYAATDVRRGVHKAPAGVEDGFLNSAIGIQKVVTKGEHDLLNPQGVNVIRSLADYGIVIWGARTTSSDPEWRYINVRRLFLFLEESIENGTYWAVFEPNDEVLWKRLVRNINAFLRVQWLEGKLVGTKPEEAFFVKCDSETNPPESVDLGRVITLIGVAPSKPAEFVIFRIMQSRAGSDTSE